MKKLLALLLALAMVLSLAACGDNTVNPDTPDVPGNNDNTPGNNDNNDATPAEYTAPDWETIDQLISAENWDEASDMLYAYNLGEFAEFYATAKEEVTDLNLRLALMAQAEAKLLESGVFMPVYGDGGSFAMSRIVPRTVTTTSWGLDEYRWYTMIVANELITSEDRDALTALWGEAEDADAWTAAAKKFLADNGYTVNDTLNTSTSYELSTWDCIASSYTSDSYFVAPTYSPLLEYDVKNVQQFALATGYTVSDDALTYTFTIREGVNWVDQQGRVIGEVTAQDWVSSMMHVADNNDELGYLMTCSDGCGIKNYDAYINGECTFDEVGVKALDKYTLEYTLEAPFPAFLSMLGYGCFAPLNADFYKAQGGTFGAEGDEYTSGDYGTTPAAIAYTGAYLVSNYTENNVTSYVANPEYWNADKVNTHAINFYYNDGSDTLRSYNECKSGVVASCGFNASALELAKSEKPDGASDTYFDLYHYTTTNSATTYCGWLNLCRGTWANFNDATVGISTQTPEVAARTRSAMNNQNFRLALAFAFDRGAFNATSVGEELKYACLKNAYVTGTFGVLTGEATIDINGTATTFPAGTYYGEIQQAVLDSDGYPIQVWDPTADGGVGSGDGFDGWYNADNAVAYLNAAIAELATVGVEITAENPIHIDVPVGSYNEVIMNRMQAYKQSIENVLGKLVIVDLVEYQSGTDYQYAYYRNATGHEANYDSSPGTSGWGPDYGDAQTFLDTIQAYGYMTKSIGLY